MVCEFAWREMERQQGSRIDLAELKIQIVKKIGVEKSRKYLNYLSRFLNQKLAKTEFDKRCFRLLGRENLPLHNLLVRSILKNACHAKTPPVVHEVVCKSVVRTVRCSPSKEDGRERSGLLIPNQNQNVPISSNGVLRASPRKARSAIRDRKFRDRSSLPGANGKVKCLPHQQMASEENGGKIGLHNVNPGRCDYRGSVHSDDERNGLALCSGKEPMIPNKDLCETDVDQEDEQAIWNLSKTPLVAPLGISFCTPNDGRSRKPAVSVNSDFVSCYGTGALNDSEMLQKRMEHIAAVQSLGGVSRECSNTLNSVVDMYLKGLIKSCVDLVGARSNRPQTIDKPRTQGKIMNGMWPGGSRTQSSGGLSDATHNQRPDQLSVSLLDFRTAMELSPQQLGENWPSLLEKVCARSFEE